MAKEKKRRYFEANQVLAEIMGEYPEITFDSVEFFTHLHYPIALLEMDMMEKSFEDFELVPLSVLKFARLGLTQPSEIAELTGLTTAHVNKIFTLLQGYGFLSEQGVTSLGEESLQAEKKILLTKSTQIFQADGIFGDLLRLGMQYDEVDLYKKDEGYWSVPILPSLEGISSESVEQQLKSDNFNQYKRFRGDIINCNVESITNLHCKDLRYAENFLLKLAGIPLPFIFCRQYDRTKPLNQRFGWRPVRLPSQKAPKEYGFDKNLPLYTPEGSKIILDIYDKLLAHRQPETFFLQELPKQLGIQPGCFLVKSGPDHKPLYLVRFSCRDISSWKKEVVMLLRHFDVKRKCMVYANNRMGGHIVRLESTDSAFTNLASALQSCLAQHDPHKVMRFVQDALYAKGEASDRAFAPDDLYQILNRFTKTDEN